MLIQTQSPSAMPEHSRYVRTSAGYVLVARVQRLERVSIHVVTTDPRKGPRQYLGTIIETRTLPRPMALAQVFYTVNRPDGTEAGVTYGSTNEAAESLVAQAVATC